MEDRKEGEDPLEKNNSKPVQKSIRSKYIKRLAQFSETGSC